MNIFANMKIGKRLALGFALILTLSGLIAGLGAWNMSKVTATTQEMMRIPLVKERLISDWTQNIHSAVVRTVAVAKSNDASLSAFFVKDAAESSKSSTEIINKLTPLLTTEAEKTMFAKIGEIRKSYIENRDAVFKLKKEGRSIEAEKILETAFIPSTNQYKSMMAEFLDLQRKSLDAEAAKVAEIEQSSQRQLFILTAFILLAGIVCAWRLTKGITVPLKEAVNVAQTVASGDLTHPIEAHSKDETGQLMQALKNMNESLIHIVGQIRADTDVIATASAQISSGNQDLSSRTEQQASSLEETASSMEELTSTVRQNADNARQANQLAVSAADVAVKGGAVVSQVVSTMDAINESSRKIVDIISVIDGIAFQTNILALNAAVEAARAGEQGRGFAVVASEVRNLAQRSASAAHEIKSLIDDSVGKVDAGSKLVGEAGATMEEIVASIKRVHDIMGEITAASSEQSEGIEQVNQAIVQMDTVTQQNAALVEEAAAAAESLQDQAKNLVEVVSVFKTNDSMLPAMSQAKSSVAAKRSANPVKQAAAQQTALPSSGKQIANARKTAGDDWEEF